MAERHGPSHLRCAQIRRPHGVRGELRVLPLGGGTERFRPGFRLLREDSGDWLTVASARALDDGEVLVTFDAVDSREAAQKLSGAYLCVDAGEARSLPEDEWFVHQLVGLRAETPDGGVIGSVTDVEEYPGHDMLVVTGPAGERRFPMARAFITRVDIPTGVIVITPWEDA